MLKKLNCDLLASFIYLSMFNSLDEFCLCLRSVPFVCLYHLGLKYSSLFCRTRKYLLNQLTSPFTKQWFPNLDIKLPPLFFLKIPQRLSVALRITIFNMSLKPLHWLGPTCLSYLTSLCSHTKFVEVSPIYPVIFIPKHFCMFYFLCLECFFIPF